MLEQTGFFTETTDPTDSPSAPVECLGLTFATDEARRAHFSELLRQKLQDPAFRQIEGFPLGTDDDILALSDPPYYTACPNPFIPDFIQQWTAAQTPADYHREPFAADVSEGKNDPIYNAHSYHTKVPHKAIMRYILHYTDPGDIVLDGFCGTGMTGVAAQLCGDKATVESLGYWVAEDGTISDGDGPAISHLGARRAILNDLSPAATFIAYNYNTPVDVRAFEREANRILQEVEAEWGWMYETTHTDGRKGKIDYTVWSQVFTCPECGHEVIFFDVAVDQEQGKVQKTFPCPNCNVELSKRGMNRSKETIYDFVLQTTIAQNKHVPILINYHVGKVKYQKKLDKDDFATIEKIKETKITYWFPTSSIPNGDKTSDPYNAGITHVHHFYHKRSLIVLSALLGKAAKITNRSISNMCRFLFEQWVIGFSKLNRYSPHFFSQNNRNLSGTLYISSQISEVSPKYAYTEKLKRLVNVFRDRHNKPFTSTITLQSTTQLNGIRNDSIDYIFTDPPFGSNLMYSELNFLLESWLKITTNAENEAIENKSQNKKLIEYQSLMSRCFTEYYRILKHGHWMTVEFHNSKNSIWNAIQEALQHAGFVIADVRTIDKQQGTFNQVIAGGAVKQDLIISAYKPRTEFEQTFQLKAGTAEGAWEFVRQHLGQLPVFVPGPNNQAEVIAERLNYLLFDRMVAFHVQRGVMVPLSASELYAGLSHRFPEREDMYFLPNQVAEYDRQRMTVRELQQLIFDIKDESSAIQWLRQQLTNKPYTFQEIQPMFMKQLAGWSKSEIMLELSDLLEQNFLRYDDHGPIPPPIWAWLLKSSSNRDLAQEGHTPDSPPDAFRQPAQDRWYVPDPNRAGDLEKLREKALLKQFADYQQSSQKRLTQFRLEAVRAGFKRAWQDKDYATIKQVAAKLPANIIEEDPTLLRFYDNALTRLDE